MNLFWSFCILNFVILAKAFDPIDPLPVLVREQNANSGYRLPNNTYPLHYKLHLKTYIHEKDAYDYFGDVLITIKTFDEPTNNITLNIHEKVIIEEVELKNEKNEVVPLEEPSFDYDLQLMVLNLPNGKLLEANKEYKLDIKFNGTLLEGSGGFYRISYFTPNNNKIWIATTHFEPTRARQAFPCYDEPQMRSNFEISITHGEKFHAVGNMPIRMKEKSTEVGMETTHFYPMENIQPYILAFAVTDYGYTSRNTTNLVPQTLLAKTDSIEKNYGDFGIFAGEKILTDLTEYFETNYHLPHMQQIAIPSFGGAMENWGLVIYDENALLYDSVNGQLNQKHGVGHIVAHEFAHQFFGNLVAPEWWSYIWLNEGFATYYAAVLMSHVFPEFNDIEIFVNNDMRNALRQDASTTTRPMTWYLEDPNGIASLFDTIAYAKSGSVLRMWEHALTEPTWKKGLIKYLTARGFKAANSDHLADALQKAVEEDKTLPNDLTAKELIDSWSQQAGYPLVTVSIGEDNTIVFNQTRFMYSDSASVPKQTFLIPISIADGSLNSSQFEKTSPDYWLRAESSSMPWDKSDWIVINKQQTGYYRVNYDEQLWKRIIDVLTSDQYHNIHVLSRAQIIDDVLNLARANIVSYAHTFKLLQYLKNELEYTPWAAANVELDMIQRLMTGSIDYERFMAFISDIVQPLYTKLGVHDKGCGESLLHKYSRNIAINLACANGVNDCLNNTKSRVDQVVKDESIEIEPDVRSAIYCNGLRTCDKEQFDNTWNKMNDNANLRSTIMSALGCCQTIDMQQKYLDTTINEKESGIYTPRERYTVLTSVIQKGGVNGVKTSIEFIKINYEKIEQMYEATEPCKNAALVMNRYITSDELNKEYTELLDTLIKADLLKKEDKDKMLEIPSENIKWQEKNQVEIKEFFDQYFSPANTPFISVFMLIASILIGFINLH